MTKELLFKIQTLESRKESSMSSLKRERGSPTSRKGKLAKQR